MKSQVAKRININLTQKDLDNLNWATENIWTGTENQRKAQARLSIVTGKQAELNKEQADYSTDLAKNY